MAQGIVVIRGGGDLASGIALRLFRAGYAVVITEVSRPLVVRRTVSFAQAVFAGRCIVEGVTAEFAPHASLIPSLLAQNIIPILIDPQAEIIQTLQPEILVDGRMLKSNIDTRISEAPLVIGMGPGFCAGENCHAVIETLRGAFLGRVYWTGSAEPDSGVPESISQYKQQRVLRAPCDGIIHNLVEIGAVVEPNQVIAMVKETPVIAQFRGLVRGLVFDGLAVTAGMKIGDVDPRLDPRLCMLVSDKALAVAGGVLEAILTHHHSQRNPSPCS